MINNLIKKRLVDFISMDIKTVVTFNEYQKVTNCINPDYPERINESARIIRMSGIQYQFRTTILPNLHSEDILASLENTFGNDPYIKQYFRSGNTIDELKLYEA